MEQSSVGGEEGVSLGAFENLVTKVMKDMSSLECRLVERIKTLETTILSNLSASTPNIADPRLGSEVEYLTSRDLEETYKVLETLIHEALTQVKSLEGNDSMDARQMARHIQEKMAGVTTKLEQVSTLVRVLNCDGPGLLHQFGERSNESRSNFGKISPPTGCGDVIGKTPLGLTFQGNSQNKTSSFLLERSFLYGSSLFSSQMDLGFEARDSGLVEDLSFKKDVGKLLRFINSNSMVDLRRYVLSHTGGHPVGPPEFETKAGKSDLRLETTPSDRSSSSSEVTLDTLVPCPHGNEIENYYCEPRAHAEDDCQVNRKTPLETSFPLQTTPCDGYDIAGSRERLYIDSVHTTDRSRLDPAAYQICPSAVIAASCANIDTAEARESHFVPSSSVGGSVKQQHKRTHSFNVSSYFYTPKKHSKISFNDFTNDRPSSTFFETTGGTSSFEVTENQSTPVTSSSSSTTKTSTPSVSPFTAQTHFPSYCTPSACPFSQSNFRRVKSEQTVKSSEKGKGRERSSDTSSKEEEKRAQERLNHDFRSECAAWRPKRKTVIVVNPTEESSRPTSGCVLANQEFDDPKFFNGHELPYIDQSPLILSDNEDDSFTDAPKSPVDAAYVNIQSLNGEVTRSTHDGSKAKEGQQTLSGLVWPSPGVTSQVTYRKNAAKLRSRWDGFRRAFSMVFEKGSNNNSNNNNNNNNNLSCMVRKASSTNFLDARGSGEGKRTRSNWEVWKKQSRANLSESFRRKCGWLRMTLRRKKKSKGHEDQQQQQQEGEESDVNTSPHRVGPRDETIDPEKTQVVMKSTLASVTDELLRTENDYVSAMKYVIDNYLPLLNYNGHTGDTGDNHGGDINCTVELPEQLRGKKYIIFGNLEKIHDFHFKRFQESLRMCKGHPYALGSAFLRHEAEFELYSLYSKNKPKSDQLMEDWGRKFFQMKQAELIDPMNLESYLLKPIQRLSKYALMLKKILQSCPLERAEYTELEAALEMVRFQLRHGEDLLAADCISGCDVNLQEQGMLIRREDLLVTKGLRKCQRHVFLFEELVLFSKTKRRPGGQDTYVYKQSLKTTDIGLTASVGEDGKQFEIWFRKRTPENSYKIQAISRDSKEKWTTDITALLWGQTQKCRQRANANVVMATGLGGRVGAMNFDSNCSRPVSFASSSSSSSNNSMDQRSIQLRHTSSMSSSSSSSAQTHSSSLDSSNSSHARPLTFQQSTNQGEGSSSTTRPLNFATKTQSRTCLSPPFSPIGLSKLSPVKEQLT